MSQLEYNQTQEYYGEYKSGFFGSLEQIYISFSVHGVSGRGFLLDKYSEKYDVTDFNYNITDIKDIENDKFNGKVAALIRMKDDVGNVYLPGLTVMPTMLKNTFEKFKDYYFQLEAERFKMEAAAGSKSSANLTLEEEIAEFKEKVNRLKIMKENGVLSPQEYQDLKARLMNLYN